MKFYCLGVDLGGAAVGFFLASLGFFCSRCSLEVDFKLAVLAGFVLAVLAV